jgi:hypothetical protein
MRIEGKKRIIKSSKYLEHLEDGDKAFIGLPITEDMHSRLIEIGFANLTVGETLVPSPKIGPVSKFNANGREIPQKQLPKEVAYRQQYREWKDWHGTTHSGIVDIPYKRFPRKLIPAPWINLTVIQADNKQFIVAGGTIKKSHTPEEDVTHRINLMLEIFKSVEILQENLQRYQVPKVRKLDWDILPEGQMPWKQFKESLSPLLEQQSKSKKTLIAERLETISKYKPDFHAVGKNGYRGYIIFGFTPLNLYIFETAEYGNATYVFEGNWETLSQMTKAEIITGNLYKHRLIHLSGWNEQVANLFPNEYKKLTS